MIIRNEKLRYIFLKVLIFIIAGIFIFRLAELQLVDGEKYRKIADNNMIKQIETEAPRGMIYSSDMQILASNRIGYAVDLSFMNVEDTVLNASLLNLSNILVRHNEQTKDTFPIKIDEQENFAFSFDDIVLEENWKKSNGFSDEKMGFSAAESFDVLRLDYGIATEYTIQEARQIIVFREQFRNQSFSSWDPIRVASDINRDTVYELDANKESLIGVSIVDEPVRSYPFGTTAAHLLGYAGKINAEEYVKENNSDENYSLNSTIGKTGLEVAFENELRGESGKEMTLIDYQGRPQDGIMDTNIPAVAGNNIVTTINLEFQQAVETALANQLAKLQSSGAAPKAASGAAVVVDVNTGAVLAMVSLPTYDPNLFTTTISDEVWNSLNVSSDDPVYPRPLYNNSTLTALQPGSTFKPLMAIAGLETGTITGDTTFFCNGRDPHIPTFTCLGYHGNTGVVNALRDSCNVFFYETGYNMGIDPIVNYAEQFGLGNSTGIEIYEDTGTLGGRDNIDDDWSEADTLNTSIGQGGSSFTPLQMANYIGTLANGGSHYQSYLVEKILNNKEEVLFAHEPKVVNKVDIDPDNLALVKKGMKKVATDGFIASDFYGFDHDDIGIGAKTGTAEYGNNSVENTSWFVCFTPYEKPEIAVSVMIIEGETSSNAAPVGREIVDAYYALKTKADSNNTMEVTP
ncbi:MAG: penicillin-binding transpeptidase domain-containing protein [Acetobacterium sp.]